MRSIYFDSYYYISLDVFRLVIHTQVWDNDVSLATYCGFKETSTEPVTSKTNNVRVVFKTDGTVNGTGFTLIWTSG